MLERHRILVSGGTISEQATTLLGPIMRVIGGTLKAASSTIAS